ncbi:MAG TPA: NAD(P)H-binding protein, partial [Algoriphagus sp.]|nr:NAD(P)H-binding protein [Algoriphagus sp.]
AQLLEGTSAVISTLGMGIPASSPDLFAKATELILQTMSEYQIRRYVEVTGLNVDADGDEKSEKTRMATEWMKANFPVSTASKQEEYKMLVESGIDWTLVRLPMIDQTDEIRNYQMNLKDCKGDKISATSLAAFLIDQLKSDKFHRSAPFIYDL